MRLAILKAGLLYSLSRIAVNAHGSLRVALLPEAGPWIGLRNTRLTAGVLVCRRIRPEYLLIFFLCNLCAICCAQKPDVLCDDGDGHFEARFVTGVSVLVTAVKAGEFAAHSCGATVSWKQQDVAVDRAAQVDIDVLGADLGQGVPVVAFQVRKADKDLQASYQIYSLERPPRLLRTITGGNAYRAADVDLDNRVAIWTGDAAAVDGFDGLASTDFDFAPVVALRFERNRLMDVSADFPADYDQRIAQVRAHLETEALQDFRNSDGKLTDGSLPAQQLALLRRTKVRVLEIAWLYLYSGREEKAWAELAAAWPPGDVDRVREAILMARKNGIDAQMDGIAPAPGHFRQRQHPDIYETERTNTSFRFQSQQIRYETIVDVPPRQILIMRKTWPPEEEAVDLVVDAAGKVWSAKTDVPDPELIQATRGWKFIPAFKDGRPVACNYRIAVSPYR